MVSFNSIEDLYKRLLPAMKTKISELKRDGFNFIECLDIWNYCIENIWKNKRDLRIYEMVDDILNIDNLKLEMFTRRNIINKKKEDNNEKQ